MTTTTATPDALKPGDVVRFSMGPNEVVHRVETLPEPATSARFTHRIWFASGRYTYASRDARFRVACQACRNMPAGRACIQHTCLDCDKPTDYVHGRNGEPCPS